MQFQEILHAFLKLLVFANLGKTGPKKNPRASNMFFFVGPQGSRGPCFSKGLANHHPKGTTISSMVATDLRGWCWD